jgi:hypothetical protein
MSDPSEWPTYSTGPKDSIFALGVVSVNYARLEFAVYMMFTTILGLEGGASARIMFKVTPEMRDKLMRESLATREWPPDVMDRCRHFVEAHKVCYENRNKLMHSNLLAMSPDAIILARTTRDGGTVLANPSLAELQRVADDMHTYFAYGTWLSNMINWEILGLKPRAGDSWHRSWPDKPPLPIPLEYTSGPRPIRPLR